MADRDRTRIEGSNVPGNPLNSYRMSMIAHGFTEEPTGAGKRWKPTLNPWLRPDGLARMPRALAVFLVVAAVIAAAIILL